MISEHIIKLLDDTAGQSRRRVVQCQHTLNTIGDGEPGGLYSQILQEEETMVADCELLVEVSWLLRADARLRGARWARPATGSGQPDPVRRVR